MGNKTKYITSTQSLDVSKITIQIPYDYVTVIFSYFCLPHLKIQKIQNHKCVRASGERQSAFT